MFEKSKWIWINENNAPDEYAEFLVDFELDRLSNTYLNISVDGNFEVYLNGKICAFGACSDYPDDKFYDSFPLEEYCVPGKNRLKITVWHIGVESFVYVNAHPGLLFSVTQNDTLLSFSDENTLSRPNINYENGLCKIITGILGPSFRYNNCVTNDSKYRPSLVVEKTNNIIRRQIRPLKLLERAKTAVEYRGGNILIDFGRETVGYIDLDFLSDSEQELLITFGERLGEDGHVPRRIGYRDFSFEFVAKKGRNQFFNAMRRIAGRYLEINCKAPLDIRYFGVRPVVYPVARKEMLFADPLHQRIYDTCVYTLECCMHEHYEDCPWREQALYALDSRNEMLCSYIAFEEYPYARFNLVLLAKSLKDGLLRITSPTVTDHPIPFFSLAFIQQVYEYVHFSGDRSVLDEVGTALDAIMQGLASKINESGLIPALPVPAWNFYEWSKGNSGSKKIQSGDLRMDLCLNAMFLYVAPMYESLRSPLRVRLDDMRAALKKTLFDSGSGFYRNSTDDPKFSVLGNALAILAGMGDKAMADRLLSQREQITDCTLSMNCYLYDALLSVDPSYKDYVIKDIEAKYSYMLDNGATTFWETLEGWNVYIDPGAGSLCHGWSAMPIYYFKRLLEEDHKKKPPLPKGRAAAFDASTT